MADLQRSSQDGTYDDDDDGSLEKGLLQTDTNAKLPRAGSEAATSLRWTARTCLAPSKRYIPWVVCALLAVSLLFRVAPKAVSWHSSSALSVPQGSQTFGGEIDTLFVFGDSYTSALMSERETFPPYLIKTLRDGDAYRRKPSYIDLLREEYNQTVMRTLNFAVGGSTVDGQIVRPFLAGSSLRDQTRDFYKFYARTPPALEWDPHKSLFTFWFGVNDIAMTHARNKEEKIVVGDDQHHPTPLKAIFESYYIHITRLYAANARNFLLLTMAPFDRAHDNVPKSEWQVAEKLASHAEISQFNAHIFDLRQQLRTAFPDASVAVFDAHRLFSAALDDPAAFPQTSGIKTANSVCREVVPPQGFNPPTGWYTTQMCEDDLRVVEHAWTDMHPTFPIHNVTAARIAADCLGRDGWIWGGYCS